MTEFTGQQLSKSDRFVAPPSRARSIARLAALWTMSKAAAGLQNLRGGHKTDGFGILMYHRVAENVAGIPAPTYNVTPKQFRRQLVGLLARGFESWPLTRLVAARTEGRSIPTNVFAVTFDDGYENNYTHAWPILRELNIPATVFLATKYLDTDQPFPFDDWTAAGSKRTAPSAWHPLSTNQCRDMLDGGLIELGAHTHSHSRFVGRGGEFLRDMRLCLEVLRDRFGIHRPTFSFPYGQFCSELLDATKQLDVTCALSTQERLVQSDDDMFQWGRFCAYQSDTPGVLAAKLSGWFSTVVTAGKKVTQPFDNRARVRSRTPIRSHLSTSAKH